MIHVVKLHRHRPQIAFPKKLGYKWKAVKGEAGGGGHRNQHWETNERLWRLTRRQRQPRAAQNGDHAGRQMKGDKAAAAAKSRPEWRSCSQEQARPEWRSWRKTNEGRQGGSDSQEQAAKEQARMEIMQGDEWRETRREIMQGGKWRGTRRQREQPRMEEMMEGNKWRDEGRQGGSGSQEQPRMEIMKGDKFGRQGGSGSQEQPRAEVMKGGKWREKVAAAAKSRPGSCREPNEVRQGGSGVTTI